MTWLRRGALIDRYVVLDLIGRGAMGTVVAAYDPHLDRKLAIKLLHSRGDDPHHQEARARLLREAQALAKLSHPNVVTVHDVGVVQGQIFLAMEHVSGSLETWLAEAPRSPRAILDAFAQAGRGLAAAHRAGLVHRDFKPANALIDESGVVRVTDFGLVASVDAQAPSSAEAADQAGGPDEPRSALDMDLTQQGAVLGTPAYMAPEQHAGERVDARADQFAFCVALYRALYGQRPYPGSSLEELKRRTAQGNPCPPPDDSEVPAWIWPVLRRGLDSDPGARHDDMGALLTALERDPARRDAERRAAHAFLALAFEKSQDGDAEGAEAALREALAAAEEQGDLEGRAEALVRLIFVVGLQGWRHEEALALAEAADSAIDLAGGDPWLRARLDGHRGLIRFHAGDHQAAREVQLRVLDQLEACGRGEGVAMATALNNLGRTLREVGELDDSLERHLGALRLAESLDAKGHEAAVALEGIACCHEALGRLDTALDWYRRALVAWQERAGEDHPGLIELRSGYGNLLHELGKPEDALEQHRHVLAAVRDHHGPGEQLATAHANVGRSLMELGRHQEARLELDQSLTQHEIGGSDPSQTLNLLGALHLALGEPAEALALFRRAQAAPPRPTVADRATSHNNMGAALAALGRLQEAAAEHQQARELWQSIHGPDHPDVADSDHHLGEIGYALGDFARARTSFARALAVLESCLGREHPSVASCATSLGNCHLALGDYSAAAPLLERALAVRRACAASPGEIGSTLFGLALALWHGGDDPPRAVGLARDALEAFQSAGEPGEANAAQVLAWLAQVAPS